MNWFKHDPNPISFEGQNAVFAKDQPQYKQLPAYIYPDDFEGRVLFCWKLSLLDRFILLFTGKLWHYVLTFNKPLQPQLLLVRIPIAEQEAGAKEGAKV